MVEGSNIRFYEHRPMVSPPSSRHPLADCSVCVCVCDCSVCVSSSRCCVLVSVVHLVAILSAVFCVICSFFMFVSDASDDHMVKTTQLWILLWLCMLHQESVLVFLG